MQRLWYAFCRWAIRVLYFGSKGGFRSIDEQHVPKTGGVLIAPIHLSYLDPPATAAATRRHLRFMAKREMFDKPIGLLIKTLGAFPVSRGESDSEAIRKAIEILENGEALLVFPEGTRGDGVTMGPINRGVGMLAKRTDAIVVPAAIIGGHIIMPREGKGRNHLMTVAFGPGFRYSDVATSSNEKENRQRFADELARRILQLMAAHGMPLKSAGSTGSPPESETPGTVPVNPIPGGA